MYKDTNDSIIEINNLTKIYRSRNDKVKALDRINLEVIKGEIFGFIGPNGAGKTTTIQVMTGIIPPTSGRVIIAGYDINQEPIKVKRRIGAMPEEIGFYQNMSGKDILEYHAEFYDDGRYRRNIYPLAEKTGVDGYLDKKVKEYSFGMRKKLAITQALINEPELLILDEPTLALDPKSIRFFIDLIKDLNKEGITIFLSSHILSVVQQLCDRIGIINDGKILRVDRVDKLSEELFEKEENPGVFFEVKNLQKSNLKEIKRLEGVQDVGFVDNRLKVKIKKEEMNIDDIISFLMKKGIKIRSINIEEPSLEDIFLKLIDGEYSG